MKRQLLRLCLMLLGAVIFASCGDKSEPAPGPNHNPNPGPPAPPIQNYIAFRTDATNQLTLTKEGANEYKIITSGLDPNLNTVPIGKPNIAESVILTFEYQASANVPFLEVFFATPNVAAGKSQKYTELAPSGLWKTVSFNLGPKMTEFSWGSIGHSFRLDWGDVSGITIRVKNMYLRAMTQEEKDVVEKEAKLESSLKSYLSANYTAEKITNVSVTDTKVTIQGTVGSVDNHFLCEVPPYVDVTMTDNFANRTQISASSINIELNRRNQRNGINYDSALSKWVIVKSVLGKDVVVSHARYADEVSTTQVMAEVKPATQKGLGGLGPDLMAAYPNDLTDLGITSVTVNLAHSGFIYSSPPASSMTYIYGGKTYYMNKTRVEQLDEQLRTLTNQNIVVAAIILVQPVANVSDKVIGNLLQHPNYTSGSGGVGTYTMPNMTTPESMNCYAAWLNFLAERYCTSGNTNGRINHWIMHNEVDAGLVWTNMGNAPVTTYMDTYVKSMRLCYNIVRQYDPHSEVFGSFTHSWAEPAESRFHNTKEMLGILGQFTQKEGDFKWALAYHSYPTNLRDPKTTWGTSRTNFTMNTPAGHL